MNIKEELIHNLQPYKEKSLAWYNEKTAQEQKIVLGLLAATLIITSVFGVIKPVSNAMTSIETDYYQQLSQKQALTKINTSASTAGKEKQSFNGSLLSIVNSTGKKHGITFEKLDPKGDVSIKTSIDRGDFNETITWLNDLSTNFGVTVSNISIDRHDDVGFANFRITLNR